MHSSLIAVVLCILAQGSAACITTADDTQQRAGPSKAHVAKVQSAGPARPGAELITTAAAGTRGAPTALRAAPLASAQPDEEHPRRAGPPMLLAALALMAGIALRRYGAGSQ